MTVAYSGSGLSATVVFNIDTYQSFSKNLNLGCSISGSTNIAYSSNTIAFTVKPCTLIGKIPVINTYTYIFPLNPPTATAIETNLLVSDYFSGLSSTCYFNSCSFLDSS